MATRKKRLYALCVNTCGSHPKNFVLRPSRPFLLEDLCSKVLKHFDPSYFVLVVCECRQYAVVYKSQIYIGQDMMKVKL